MYLLVDSGFLLPLPLLNFYEASLFVPPALFPYKMDAPDRHNRQRDVPLSVRSFVRLL